MLPLTQASLRTFLEEQIPTLKTGEYTLRFKMTLEYDVVSFCMWLRDLGTSIQEHNATIDNLDLTYGWCYNTIYIHVQRAEKEPEEENDVIGISDLVIRPEGIL